MDGHGNPASRLRSCKGSAPQQRSSLTAATASGIGAFLLCLGALVPTGGLHAEVCDLGTFIPSNLSLRITYNDLAVGDVLGTDGRSEILITQPPVGSQPSQVAILRYQGNGAFSDTLIDVGMEPSGIVVANLNGDALQDFAVTCALSDSVYVFYQTPTGLCREVISPSHGSESNIAAGLVAGRFFTTDMPGPAPQDIATAQSFDPSECPTCLPQSARLLSFTTGTNCPGHLEGTSPYDLHQEPGIWAIDAGNILTGSGSTLVFRYGEYHPDLLDGDPCGYPRSANHIGLGRFSDDSLVLVQLLNINTDGFFTNGSVYDVCVGPVVGERFDDVVVGAGACAGIFSFVTIRPSTGDSLAGYSDFIGVGPYIYDLDLGDLTGDGRTDVLITTPGSDLTLAATDGNGHFTAACRIPILGTTLVSAVGDYDGDDIAEIATLVTEDPFNEEGTADIHLLEEGR